LNGANHGDDGRLAIDVASMKESLHENGAYTRMIRWVPGNEQIADDLMKLMGNNKLSEVLAEKLWSLRDSEVAKTLRSDAAARKRRYRQRISRQREAVESARRLQRG
jgi:predicted CopG family antitoxin